MPATSDLRESIQVALRNFTDRPLADVARSFLDTLGYRSDRTLDLGDSSADAFISFVNDHANGSKFDKDKAHFAAWKSVDLLFQLTDEELGKENSLFKDTKIQPGLLRSYLFFAIELTGDHYPRGCLTQIARQINRVFPMPVMVIFKHRADCQPVLSIAIINRRQNKREADKDVLGKVTIIRDISLIEPHRGHLEILHSFSTESLRARRLPISNFDELHALNTQRH